MVHVSEYHIGTKKEVPEKSNVVLRVVCIKCGKSHDQEDVGVFMRNYTCPDCEDAEGYDKFRRRLHEVHRR